LPNHWANELKFRKSRKILRQKINGKCVNSSHFSTPLALLSDLFYLSGITSWGDKCAQQNNPGIYTMLTPYLSWIENITGIVT
jgi:hypothetical protein